MIEHQHPLAHGSRTNDPKRIIVHAMGEHIEWQGATLHAPVFLDRIGLSVHAMVCPDGSVIRCRDDQLGAWHAKGHNTDTLGVEVLVPGATDLAALKAATARPYLSGDQFKSLIRLVRGWMDAYQIPVAGVLRHSDLDPDRRWFDPGDAFPWDLFREELTR